jgi:hypothetical protein
MRERRWETTSKLEFSEVLTLGERLADLGLKPAVAAKDVICYIEEWTVQALDDLDQLDPWPLEDVTLVHTREVWHGDFFLLAGGYHTVYQRHQTVGTYCSVSHPWRLSRSLETHQDRGMFWLGFRHAHAFIRVRLHTNEVITPGETRADDRRSIWLADRREAFEMAIGILELPIESEITADAVLLLKPVNPKTPMFCSWPDAFGPCQFEYNSSDVFEFLVPASRLASTYGSEPPTVRAYLTGFSEEALGEFGEIAQDARCAYRCSAHCPLDDLPEVLANIQPDGRLYTTLCEFPTQRLLPQGEEASAIIGVVGREEKFQIEIRLNRAPLPEEEMAPWLQRILGLPVTYAPLPPFP